MNTVWRVHSSPCVNMVLVVRSLVSMTLLSQDFRPIDVMNTDYRRQATSHTLPFYRCLYLPVFVTSVHSICNSSGQHDTTLNIEINGWFFLLCCHCCSLLFSLFFFRFCCWLLIFHLSPAYCTYSYWWRWGTSQQVSKQIHVPRNENLKIVLWKRQFTAKSVWHNGWKMANETQNLVHYITFRLAIFNFMNVQKHYGVKKSTQSTAH